MIIIPPMPIGDAASATRSELYTRRNVAVMCLIAHGGVLAACAAIGALRLPDLAIIGAVTAPLFVAAVRDHRWLGVMVAAVWIYAPLVRRLVDWQLGGFTPRTALSLLPMMATLVLAIPSLPRWRLLAFPLRQSLLMIAGPMIYAGGLGLLFYGPSAVFEAGDWLLPLLFYVYYATRGASGGQSHDDLTWIVVLATTSAAYAWYQYLVLPSWDQAWLIQSGMTSSGGRPYPLEIRAWGTMNSYAPAARVWAMMTLVAVAQSRLTGATRNIIAAVLATALLITFARTAWLMLILGALFYLALAGRRKARPVLACLMGAVALAPLAVVLPGGERILSRVLTFQDLEADDSYQDRQNIAAVLTDKITRRPLGVGIGFQTAGRVAGDSEKFEVIDNGIGEAFLSMGVLGCACWAMGLAQLASLIFRVNVADGDAVNDRRRLASSIFLMSAAAMASDFSFGGLVGALTWCQLGILAPGHGMAASVAERGVAPCYYANPEDRLANPCR